jgi:hypothetical protein
MTLKNEHNADAPSAFDPLVRPSRAERIAEFRRRQPMPELERKWVKARGRWSNRYWAAEWRDLAEARAQEMLRKLQDLPPA